MFLLGGGDFMYLKMPWPSKQRFNNSIPEFGEEVSLPERKSLPKR